MENKWNKTDPRGLFSSGLIVIFDIEKSESMVGFFDSKYGSNYYVHTSHEWDRYQRIAPGEEIEEWPQSWLWCFAPKVEEKDE